MTILMVLYLVLYNNYSLAFLNYAQESTSVRVMADEPGDLLVMGCFYTIIVSIYCMIISCNNYSYNWSFFTFGTLVCSVSRAHYNMLVKLMLRYFSIYRFMLLVWMRMKRWLKITMQQSVNIFLDYTIAYKFLLYRF